MKICIFLHPLVEFSRMVTTPINSLPQSKDKVGSGKNFALKTEDFINMMITQLQNQDPLEPAKNQELLAQMSQIGQLQSQTLLSDSLKGMVLQNSLGSAGNLIGKMVQGQGATGDPVSGLVNSVRVEDNNVFLELDNGKSLQLTRVTSIAQMSGGASTETPAVTAPAK